jgi:hypothetical protein
MSWSNCLPVAVPKFVRGNKNACLRMPLHLHVLSLTPRLGSSSLHNRWNANIKPIEARERIGFNTSWHCDLRGSSSPRSPSVLGWESAVSENLVKHTLP